ncbi:ABC transporter permease [Longirhabdus pacifica]|uniref:ABC transporter permease n=1 Tax=Longirhabdus pacifica TaxID=2305227 RepID=UPI001008A32D|nr:sugar ABC transporter permease [Longirhabdus pacifica]
MEWLSRPLRDIYKNRIWLLMVLPGLIWFILFAYIPMGGQILAFKDFRQGHGGFISNVINSEWVGFENFEYLFTSNDAWEITRNTLGYNLVGIFLGLVFAVTFAIILSEIANKKLAKIYQTGMLFPHFLSWVVVSYFAFAFLSKDNGLLNNIFSFFGLEAVSFYYESEYWPFILVFMGLWKSVGYSTIFYLAAIVGIDRSYYEAAMIDGATKWQQVKHITIPMLVPLMIILTILALGGIFNSDFGLFYQLPRDSGALYEATNVIDTYVYRALQNNGDIGMSTAVGLYKSTVGFILVLLTNYIVRKIDEEQALF